MKQILSLLVAILTLASLPALSQIRITGTVRDSLTGTALSGASIFAQNTTAGTISDSAGRFRLSLESGGYDLIISYTGYQSQELRVTDQSSGQLDIALLQEDNSLGEVVIQSSNEVKDGWEKYGDFFLDQFIGATPFAKNCRIENPDVIHFFYYKRSDRLKVLADEPLSIRNDALGYNLRYQLDSFVYYYKEDLSSYRGSCFFTEQLGTVAQALKWKANREKAYYGSKLHFMRAYYDNKVFEEGFFIDILDEKDNTRFGRITRPYDSLYYYAYDSLEQVEVFYPRTISITYTAAVPENDYLRQKNLPMDVGVQLSYVDLLDPIQIKSNGYYFPQRNLINQGYWSWKNLADLLPFDYSPEAYKQE